MSLANFNHTQNRKSDYHKVFPFVGARPLTNLGAEESATRSLKETINRIICQYIDLLLDFVKATKEKKRQSLADTMPVDVIN